jgi:hypothetical protein
MSLELKRVQLRQVTEFHIGHSNRHIFKLGIVKCAIHWKCEDQVWTASIVLCAWHPNWTAFVTWNLELKRIQLRQVTEFHKGHSNRHIFKLGLVKCAIHWKCEDQVWTASIVLCAWHPNWTAFVIWDLILWGHVTIRRLFCALVDVQGCWLTYSMEQSPSSEANMFTAIQDISHILGNPKVHYHKD